MPIFVFHFESSGVFGKLEIGGQIVARHFRKEVNRDHVAVRAAALRLIYPWLHMVTRPGIADNVRCDSEIFRG